MTKIQMLSKSRNKHWETETSEELVFFKHFETPDSQICLGDYFQLLCTNKNILFYLQTFQPFQTSEEPICIFISNVYWKKLLEFDFSKRMKAEQDVFDLLEMNSTERHTERWNFLKKAYSTFWKRQHPYFQIDFVKEPTHTRTHCNLYMTVSDINILIKQIDNFDKETQKQNKKIKPTQLVSTSV